MNRTESASTSPQTPIETYASNASLEEIADRLRRAKRVVLLTHSKPDGDAIGSTLALARTLDRLGIEATPVYLSPWLRRIEPIIGDTNVIHEHHRCWEKPPLSKADTVVIADTGTWSQVADARPWLERRAEQAIIIDHHAHGDPEIASMRYIDAGASATALIMAKLCAMLLGLDCPRDFDLDIAEPLYVGLATDTGWFRYSNTTPATLRLAADLIDAGAEHARLYTMIEQGDSPSRLRLVQKALATLELFARDRAALMTVTQESIREASAEADELGGLTDLPQTIGTVRVVGVITQLDAKVTKVSFRSKPAVDESGFIDVNALARTLGGGGHVHAAGAKIHLPLDEAKPKIIEALLSAVGP